MTALGKGIVAGALLLMVLIGTGVWYLSTQRAPAPVACTAEAMQCPDGSYVGRTGPDCSFVCPSVATTTTTTGQATSTTGGSGGFAEYHSGIRGTVLAGPTCPVERNPPDPACADKPVVTNVSIVRASDKTHTIAVGTSDAQGKFEFSLPPGDYVVQSGSYGTPYPRCADVPATVGPTGYAAITVSCDSGIR